MQIERNSFMPSEPLPWDRKPFLNERKREKSSEFVESSGWRDTTPHSWGSAEFRSRPLGCGNQGYWHMYSEISGRGFMPSWSNENFIGDESCRNNSRECKGSFSQKDWKRGYRESNWSSNQPARLLAVSDQRSVGDSHPRSVFVSGRDQVRFRGQHNATSSVNGLVAGHKFDLGPIDWKSRKWARASGFSHASSLNSMGGKSSKEENELQLSNVTPVQPPSSSDPSEETRSTKKPRIGWGDGLAEYEKKKVEGPDESLAKGGLIVSTDREPLHSLVPNLSDKSPMFTRFSDCTSAASPSLVGCSSSPGVEDKPSVRAAEINGGTDKLGGAPILLSHNHAEGIDYNLNNLDLTPIANLSSSISELLQSNGTGPADSSNERSTAMKKLLAWKGHILRAVEITELDIDSLENELNLLTSESRNSWPCLAGSSSLHGKCQAEPCEELVDTSTVAKVAMGGLVEEKNPVEGDDIDSHVTSKLVEPLSTAKAAGPDSVKHGESSGDLNATKLRNQELISSVYDGVNEEKTEGVAASVTGSQLVASNSCSAAPVGAILHRERENLLCDQILASNKDSANRASEVFNRLFPSEQCGTDMLTTCISSWQIDPQMKKKFVVRKRFLRFKERVITLKFMALRQLWKEDVRLLSVRKRRAKSHKRFELCSRTLHSGSYRKYRPYISSLLSTCV